MGFGLLFVSYLLAACATATGPFAPLFGFVGGAGMVFACFKLKAYDKKFRLPLYALIVFALWNAVWGGFAIGGLFTNSHPLDFFTIVANALFVTCLVFLLLAMRSVAADVGRVKIASRCRLSIIVVPASSALLIGCDILRQLSVFSEKDKTVTWTYYILFALYLLSLVFIALQIMSCYRWICEEGDEDMPERENFDPLSKMIKKVKKKK